MYEKEKELINYYFDVKEKREEEKARKEAIKKDKEALGKMIYALLGGVFALWFLYNLWRATSGW